MKVRQIARRGESVARLAKGFELRALRHFIAMRKKIICIHKKELYDIGFAGSRRFCEVTQRDLSKGCGRRVKKARGNFIERAVKLFTMKFHFGVGQKGASFSNKSPRIPLSISIHPSIKHGEQLVRLR